MIAPAKVESSLRLKIRAPLSVTLPLSEPVVPPAPTCNVPAEITVPPEWVAPAERMSVPEPDCVSTPVPDNAPDRVAVPAEVNCNVALFTTVSASSLPPIWNVPALTVSCEVPVAWIEPCRVNVPLPVFSSVAEWRPMLPANVPDCTDVVPPSRKRSLPAALPAVAATSASWP